MAPGRQKLSTGFLLAIILIIAAALRLFYFVEIQDNPLPLFMVSSPTFDSHNFVALAQDIRAHHWLGSYATGYSPVYSYLIAGVFQIFGVSLNSIFLFQMILDLALVYLIFQTTCLLFGEKEIGLLAAFLAACYGPFLYYEGSILRESVIGFCNLLSFFLMLKAFKENQKGYFLFAGVGIGLAMALRPGFLIFFLVPYIFFAVRKSWSARILSCVIFFLGVMLAIFPFWLRNQMIGAAMITEKPGPTIFWIGNTYDADGMGFYVTDTQEKLAAITEGRILKTIQVWYQEIQRHPREYLSLYGRKFQMLFNGYEVPSNDSYDLAYKNSTALKMSFVDFKIIAPLALVGLVLIFRKVSQAGLLYLFLFSLNFLLFVFYVQSRHRLPIIPFYIIPAAYTIYYFYLAIQMRRYKLLVPAMIGVILVSLFTKPNEAIINQIFHGRIRCMDFSNMALAYRYVYENNLNLSDEQKQTIISKAIKFREKSVINAPQEYQPFYNSDLNNLYALREQWLTKVKEN